MSETGKTSKQSAIARKSKIEFRVLMQSAPDAIIIYNMDNTFSEVNPAACELVGYTREEMLKMKVTDFLQPAEQSRLVRVKAERMKGSKRLVEWKAKRKDGSFAYIEANTHFLEDRQQWLSFIRDISYRKAMEEEIYQAGVKERVLKTKTRLLRQQQKKLLAINKVKDEFILVASHQLRTPATGVKQYIAMILDGFAGEVNDKTRTMLEIAYASNERQLKIVNDLLYIAQIDAGEVVTNMSDQDIITLIKDLTAELSPTFERKKQLLKLSLPDKCHVPHDSKYLRLALECIILNACHYSDEGKPILIKVITDPERVTISVIDQGIGIKKSDQKLLFQKFSRIPSPVLRSVEGNGLGLYLAKQIIDMHKGTISIESKAGKGSTFSVTLPLAAVAGA